MKKADLKRYAYLITKVGANVQKGQDVTVYANLDQEELANYIVEYCYKLGAKLVSVEWVSDKITKTQYKKASVKALSEFPTWKEEKQKHINATLPAVIYIESSDPDALKGVNQSKLAVSQAVEDSVLIDTNSKGLTCANEPEGSPDLAHYDSTSQILLGKLFAEEAIKFFN